MRFYRCSFAKFTDDHLSAEVVWFTSRAAARKMITGLRRERNLALSIPVLIDLVEVKPTQKDILRLLNKE